MKEILSHTQGPFGVPGYAGIVVADGVFGTGAPKGHFPGMVMRLTQFMEELGEMI